MSQNEIVLMQTWCEEVTWFSYETFNPLKTLRPDESTALPPVTLSSWTSSSDFPAKSSFLLSVTEKCFQLQAGVEEEPA